MLCWTMLGLTSENDDQRLRSKKYSFCLRILTFNAMRSGLAFQYLPAIYHARVSASCFVSFLRALTRKPLSRWQPNCFLT